MLVHIIFLEKGNIVYSLRFTYLKSMCNDNNIGVDWYTTFLLNGGGGVNYLNLTYGKKIHNKCRGKLNSYTTLNTFHNFTSGLE